jgi:hypothetical protein
MSDRSACAVVALLAACALAAPAAAQTGVVFSPDVTADLGIVQSSTVADEDIGYDDAASRVYRLPAFPSPPEAELTGLDYDVGAAVWLVSFDVTAVLPGLTPLTPAEPRDVVSWDPATGLFAIVFDGSAAGVPPGARIDGLGLDGAGDLVLSFDVSTLLPALGPVDDEDVVSYSGGFSLLFDGSVAGLAPELDVDGVHYDFANAVLWLSFDTSGTIGGLGFDDEDVLAYDVGAGSYSMVADSSLSDPIGWPPADLVAVPEPGAGELLVSGIVLLGVLAARAARRR